MPEIGTSGSMSEDGKRSVAKWPKLPRLSSTLPQSGRTGASIECLLSGVKRTLPLIVALSANDPKRTKAGLKSRSATGSCVLSLVAAQEGSAAPQ